MEAIILKKTPTKEYDELVTCYGPETGKATYIAKSSLKPISKQASHLQVLNLADFNLIKKNNLPIITSACAVETFPNLRRSLPAMTLAQFLLEVFDRFVFDEQADEQLWALLDGSLRRYDLLARKHTASWRNELKHLETAVVSVLGYDPSVDIEELAMAAATGGGRPLASLLFAAKVLK